MTVLARGSWRRLTGVALLVPALVALATAAFVERDPAYANGDELEYLVGAASLVREARLDFGRSPTSAEPQPMFREPGYPAAIALAWTLAGADAVARLAALEPRPAGDDPIGRLAERTHALARLPADAALWRPIRALNLLALAVAAAAIGFAVFRLEGPAPGALAALLVAASPALRASAALVMSEVVAAAGLALLSAGLVALRTDARRPGTILVALSTALLPLFRAEGVLLLPLAAWALARSDDADGWRRTLRRFAGAFVLLALPTVLWLARNAAATGHFKLSDRGGLALVVRAELDQDVARFGARVALLSFTPSAWARDKARELAPDSTLLDRRPERSQSFLLRTYRRFDDERLRPGADWLEIDARLGRGALERFLHHPIEHLVTAVVVGWRGLFVESSPAWAEPFDLSLPLSLLLAFAAIGLAALSTATADAPRLTLLVPAAILVAFHLAATEFLPRYALPILPVLWGALVLFGWLLWRRQRERDDAAD